MDQGTAILIMALIGALSFIIRNTMDNLIAGLWVRYARELVPGDQVTVKSDFGDQEGVVKEVHLRNIIIELEDERELLVEAKKIFEDDVIRRRE